MIAKSWLSRCWQWQIGGCVAIIGVLSVGVSDRVLAQIVPDNTLGAESSVVTPNLIQGIPSDQIDGGARSGANLFHSFSQFNVGAGRGAYFTDPAGILNILTRVTGANRSEILGRLGVLGDANLFLINPNGIVFGPSASLDVQGSFLATTADAVKLGEAGLFSASQPTTSNLLSVSPSALWFNAVAAQPIVNRSQAPSPIGQLNSDDGSPGLQVPLGRTLALVGGDVLLEGGNLTAEQGRIELGSVAGVGQVSLTQTGNSFLLGYGSINDFGNISLSNGAFVDASGPGGGEIQVQGGRLEMTQNSYIGAYTLGAENGKQVLVHATEAINLDGSFIVNSVAKGAVGNGGNIILKAGSLSVTNGTQLQASTSGQGNAGNVNIEVRDTVFFDARDNTQRFTGVFTVVNTPATQGNGGDINITTGSLAMTNYAVLLTSTSRLGNAGNINIQARDTVSVTKSAQLATFTSGQGNAGKVNIEAGNTVSFDQVDSDGGRTGVYTIVNTPTTQGNGGDINITTGSLAITNGAVLVTATNGQGNAGSVNIQARDTVSVDGGNRFSSVVSSEVTETGVGKGGDINIKSGSFSLTNRALLIAETVGQGDAGNVTINTGNLTARNGLITTSSEQSSGGRINITASKIRLFGDSDITTNVNSGAGDSGDIDLKAGSILAFDDSDILAYAENGKGGDITLKTPAFFGENYRPALRGTDPDTLDHNNQVDVNADSNINPGNIIEPDVSFIPNSLTELPDNQIDTDSLLANSCIVRRNQPTRGSFTITGTGGLPQRPGDAQMSTFPTVNIETLPSDSTPSTTNPNRPWQKGDPIVEPQGVYRLPNGKLVLSRECS
jgi:filamentous hemagglutinin family protein